MSSSRQTSRISVRTRSGRHGSPQSYTLVGGADKLSDAPADATTGQAISTTMIGKIVLESADPLALAGIRSVISAHPGTTEVPTTHLSDAGLLLLVTPRMSAKVMARLRELARGTDQVRIVVVLDELGEADLFTALELGVAGFVFRSQATAVCLIRALKLVRDGAVHLPPAVQSKLVKDVVRTQRQVLTPRGLTASGLESREVEVLRYLAEGLETADIARQLQHSERTVKTILYGMMERLELRTRSQAVAYALRSGVV